MLLLLYNNVKICKLWQNHVGITMLAGIKLALDLLRHVLEVL